MLAQIGWRTGSKMARSPRLVWLDLLCPAPPAHLYAFLRAFLPHARAKKLPRAAECPVYSLTPSGVLAENHPKKSGFRRHLVGSKMLKETFFTAISRWRVVSRRALDASGFWQG